MGQNDRHKILPGAPFPLGATPDANGVNFALFSEHAEAVELCLFDAHGEHTETKRVPLLAKTDCVWHVYLEGIASDQLYGYRLHGEYNPRSGHRFNPAKVLLDPYARALGRNIQHNPALHAFLLHKKDDSLIDTTDSAPFAPLGAVASLPLPPDTRPGIPRSETILYETHVRGMTTGHPELPASLRGTYAGLASDPVIDYVKTLGITTLNLLPVHYHIDEGFLRARSLTNYWGYNTLGFFIPHPDYASEPEDAPLEFQKMVQKLHLAGLEVILDVVYNHTAEGDHLGPTLSFKGIDNASYYKLDPVNRGLYLNYTGCGNTFNAGNPWALKLIMDSLRYWATMMNVDGFRFDLTSTLGRDHHFVNMISGFFQAIHQDPLLSRLKLIAEPWDLGEEGYQLGNFPIRWNEWNGQYRDGLRKFWRGDDVTAKEILNRFDGSPDLFSKNGKNFLSSTNYITSHDGFTLHDLVTYTQKRNEANGENNRDGTDHNLSHNYGKEGPSDDPTVVQTRRKQMKNFLVSLFLSKGVPMLLHGDERGRSQNGNNNGYCQDNRLSYIDWQSDSESDELFDLIRFLVTLRKGRNPNNFVSSAARARKEKKGELVRLDREAAPIVLETTDHEPLKSFALLFRPHDAKTGETSLLAMVNASESQTEFRFPEHHAGSWRLLLSTDPATSEPKSDKKRETFPLPGRCIVLFEERSEK